MNALRLSTFMDRFRNSYVDLDDIIEENATLISNESNRSLNEFYLMLYFTANWLPNAFNKSLNNRLEEFLASSQRNNIQLILISSDKTKDSYYEFLKENKFIRYSLIFHEQDTKNELYRYFKINGIPYLTMVKIELDAQLKISHLKASKTNIKSAFLNDKDFKGFPWLNQSENVNAELNADQVCTDLKSILVESKKSRTNRSRKRSDKATNYFYAINEIFDNLVYLKQCQKSNSQDFRLANFMFVLFGSSESQLNQRIVQSLSEFWRVFKLKHKFFVVYLELGKNDDTVKLDVDVNWFTIQNDELKHRIALLYDVTQVPNLVIVDTKSGRMLNSSLRFQMIKYVDEFCKEKLEKAKQIELILNTNASIESNQPKLKPIGTNLSENRKLSFDLPIRNFLQKKISHSSCELRQLPCLKTELLERLKGNLLDIYTMNKVQTEDAKETNAVDLYPNSYFLVYFCSNSTTSNSYFYEKSIQFAVNMKENIECDIKLLVVSSDGNEQDYQSLLEKLRVKEVCHKIKEEEKNEQQQQKEDEQKVEKEKEHITRLSLDFECKHIKENLIKQLNVLSIPWFSLVNAANGDILCQNLKLLILHEELTKIVF